MRASPKPSELTLQDHAEAWWREQGKTVPPRCTPEHAAMYEQWVEYAFADFEEAKS